MCRYYICLVNKCLKVFFCWQFILNSYIQLIVKINSIELCWPSVTCIFPINKVTLCCTWALFKLICLIVTTDHNILLPEITVYIVYISHWIDRYYQICCVLNISSNTVYTQSIIVFMPHLVGCVWVLFRQSIAQCCAFC